MEWRFVRETVNRTHNWCMRGKCRYCHRFWYNVPQFTSLDAVPEQRWHCPHQWGNWREIIAEILIVGWKTWTTHPRCGRWIDRTVARSGRVGVKQSGKFSPFVWPLWPFLLMHACVFSSSHTTSLNRHHIQYFQPKKPKKSCENCVSQKFLVVRFSNFMTLNKFIVGLLSPIKTILLLTWPCVCDDIKQRKPTKQKKKKKKQTMYWPIRVQCIAF